MTKINNKIIVITGTTASGKTSLAVDLARQFNGEIISADSRQVYKYMNIGTGKDLREYKIQNPNSKIVKIPYHCIDLVHPNTEFSLGKWYKRASKAIGEIKERERVPIVAGGTGLYTQALVDGYNLTTVKPNAKLRAKLEKLSVQKLYIKLVKLDKKFADNLHDSDKKNKRRLIRYIEIKSHNSQLAARNLKSEYNSLVIGLTWPPEVLKKRIYQRLIERIEKEKMIEEVENLHKKHRVSWKRLNDFGLEYRYVSLYLRDKIGYEEMVEELARAIYQFSRRQMSWLRRWERCADSSRLNPAQGRQGRKIHWVKNKSQAKKLVRQFLR